MSPRRWTECVIDAGMGARDGLFCFCPIVGDIDGEFAVVEGMNYVDTKPPDGLKLVAVVHSDGQEAVEAFCKEHEAALTAMKEEVHA